MLHTNAPPLLERRPGVEAAGSRLDWMDHLRVAIVMLVVVHHVALVYGAASPFYYVEPPIGDPNGFKALLVFVLFNQAWFMGALFLLAGYFTPGSFDRKGAGRFARDRIVRLGIPLVVYAFVLNPIAELGVYLMPSELTGITGSPTWDSYPDMIGMGPLWFVAMLLVFSIVYAAWRTVRRGGGSNGVGSSPGLAAIVGFTIVLAAAGWLMRLIVPLGESFLQFPTLAYLPQYLSFFVLGVVAYRRGWLQSLKAPAGWAGAASALGAAVLLFPYAFSGRMFSLDLSDTLENAMGGVNWQAAAYALWDAVFAIGIVLALLVVFRAFMDRGGGLGSFLSRHGYAVYVVHVPVVVFGAYLLRGLELGTIAKFAVASIVLVPISFAVAFVVRSMPGVKRVL